MAGRYEALLHARVNLGRILSTKPWIEGDVVEDASSRWAEGVEEVHVLNLGRGEVVNLELDCHTHEWMWNGFICFII